MFNGGVFPARLGSGHVVGLCGRTKEHSGSRPHELRYDGKSMASNESELIVKKLCYSPTKILVCPCPGAARRAV